MSDLAVNVARALRSFGTGERKIFDIGPRESQDPLDKYLHRLYISNEGRKYFDAMYKKEIELLYDKLGPDARNAINQVTGIAAAEHFTVTQDIASTPNMLLALKAATPRANLNRTKLETAMRKAGLSAAKVEKVFEEATEYGAPPKTYIITPL